MNDADHDGDVLSPPEVPGKKKRRRGRSVLGPRARTIAPKRLSKEELRTGALLSSADYERPKTRRDCLTAGDAAKLNDGRDDGLGDGVNCQRPCPWVGCRHHLYMDPNPETGSIKLNFPHLEVWELRESCALDVADRGGVTLEQVGEILNLTRERIRQVEVRGLLRLKGVGISLSGESEISTAQGPMRETPRTNGKGNGVPHRKRRVPKPVSQFATPEFAAKVRALAPGLAKRIGEMASKGALVETIAREHGCSQINAFAVLRTIRDGEPIPYIDLEANRGQVAATTANRAPAKDKIVPAASASVAPAKPAAVAEPAQGANAEVTFHDDGTMTFALDLSMLAEEG